MSSSTRVLASRRSAPLRDSISSHVSAVADRQSIPLRYCHRHCSPIDPEDRLLRPY